MVYAGPFDARPQDAIGLAVGRTHVNHRVAAAAELQNAAGLGPVPVQGAEYAVELYYSLHAIAGLILRPNLQYVHNPGGSRENRDAVVVGLKTVVAF
jgi:porin